MSTTARETRTRREWKIEPDREDPGTDRDPVRLFVIRETAERQTRDGRAASGWATLDLETRDIAAGLTRARLVTLIESAAGWLAYLGEED